MNNFLRLLVILVVFSSCKKEDEVYVWQDEQFAKEIETGSNELVKEGYDNEIYKNGTLDLSFKNLSKYNSGANREVKYTCKVDSLTFTFLDKNINLDYDLKSYGVFIDCFNKDLNESGKLTVTLHGTWYYEDVEGVKYTDGDTVKFGNEEEKLVFDYENRIPHKFGGDYLLGEFEGYYFGTLKMSFLKTPEKEYESANNNYKVKLVSKLCSENDTVNLLYEINDSYHLVFKAEEVPVKDIEYTSRVIAQWWVEKSSGVWEHCEDSDEVYEKVFYSGSVTGLDHDRIKVTYPLFRQCNYLKDEYDKGYIKMKHVEFDKYINDLDVVVKCTSFDSELLFASELSYNESLAINEYDVPTHLFENGEIYKLSFIDQDTEKEVYSYHFRTSIYSSFEEKWVGEQLLAENLTWSFPGAGSELRMNVYPVSERMDSYEAYHTDEDYSIKPLIQFNSTIPEEWNNSKQLKLYSIADNNLARANEVQIFGAPPTDAMFFRAIEWLLTDENIKNNTFAFNDGGHNWRWKVLEYIYSDYNLNKTNYQARLESYPDIDVEGFKYPPFDVFYVLPEIELTTTKIEGHQIP